MTTTQNTSPRAVLHTTGPKVHYVLYVNEDNRLVGPFPTKREAQRAVDAANARTKR